MPVIASATEPIVQVVLCVAVILIVGKIVSAFCRRIGQPVVIGEIIAGVMLGPSLLGLFPGDLEERLFPLEIQPYLKIIAQVGLILFMFVVGLEVDLAVVRRSGRRAVTISLTSIFVPLALGLFVLGPALHGDHRCVPMTPAAAEERGYTAADRCAESEVGSASGGAEEVEAADGRATPLRPYPVPFFPFALFMGVAMCGTAFAVLARILAERNMFKIPLGALLVACAAVDDVMAFTLLAFAAAVATGASVASIGLMLVELAVFVAVLFLLVRPLLDRFVVEQYRRTGSLSLDRLGLLFIGLLLSSYATAQIGVHEIIGAFLFGVVIPRANAEGIFHEIAHRIEGVSLGLLLPVFFVIAGQAVDVTQLTSADILPLVLILACAFIGKFGGAALAARATGVPRRQSYAVGTMMNTRGLTELVILAVGLDAFLIDTRVYTMFVIMAVLTTAMAGPLLNLVYPMKWLQRDIAEAERRAEGGMGDRAFVVIEGPDDAERLTDAAVAFGGRHPAAITLVRFVDESEPLDALARVLAETEDLRQTVEARGARATVICRRSEDPAADVVREVERGAPDAVFLARDDAAVVAAIAAEGVDTVVVGAPIDPTVPVVTDGGAADADLARVELGARFALHAGTSLEVRGAGRRIQRRLDRLGVTRGQGSLVVAAPGGDGPIVVHPGARDRVDLVERLGSWRYAEAFEPAEMPSSSMSG